MDELERMTEEVNPVYLTARSCLYMCARNGEEDAKKLLDILQRHELREKDVEQHLSQDAMALLEKANSGYTANIEARYYTTENYIKELGITQILDLPCGFSSRGLRLAKEQIDYYGCDLPAVINELLPAIRQLVKQDDKQYLHYNAADATNYGSLKKALKDAKGELLITTEGLLPYLTQSETEEFFLNVRKLIGEYGGCWITMDIPLAQKEEEIMRCILGDDYAQAMSLTNNEAGMHESVLFDKDEETVLQFIDDMGFDLMRIPVMDYLPEELASLKNLLYKTRNNAMELYRQLELWVMVPWKDETEKYHAKRDAFSAEAHVKKDKMNIRLSGRLDTISSPDLLTLFREPEKKIVKIRIDASDLTYISSAGLRVFMIMYKSLPDGDFKLYNASENIKEILETTGFDFLL